MGILNRFFKHKKKPEEQSRAGRTVMPVALSIAALNRFYGKPDSYVPLDDIDRVGEMASSAAAVLAHEMDHGMVPTPFGTRTPDYTPTEKPKNYNPNTQLKTTRLEDGIKELILDSNAGDGYLLNGKINGKRVKFLVDTGATQVSIPSQLAHALGLERKGRSVNIRTANGLVIAYETELDSIELGEIELRFIPALINPGDSSDTILLGMSALRHLEFTHRDRQLILRQHPPKKR